VWSSHHLHRKSLEKDNLVKKTGGEGKHNLSNTYCICFISHFFCLRLKLLVANTLEGVTEYKYALDIRSRANTTRGLDYDHMIKREHTREG
jgi:hypothetical protein